MQCKLMEVCMYTRKTAWTAVLYDVVFNKRVGVFYHNIKHDA
jgi:hypothetical protein